LSYASLHALLEKKCCKS